MRFCEKFKLAGTILGFLCASLLLTPPLLCFLIWKATMYKYDFFFLGAERTKVPVENNVFDYEAFVYLTTT